MPSSSPPPTYYRPPPPEGGGEPVAPILRRVGAVVGAGVIAAGLACVPAALRVAAASVPEGFPGAWLALVACAIVPCVVGVAVLRSAREGLRAFAGPDASLHLLGLIAWIVSTFAATAVLGAALRATTHHHGLAGVTFAVAALAASIGAGLVIRRFVVVAQRGSARLRAVIVWGSVAAASLVVLAASVAMARAAPAASPLPPSTGALFVDLLAYGIAIGFLSRAEFARRHLLASLGLPLAVGLVTLGVLLLLRSPPLEDALFERAPALAPLAGLIVKR
jgi:hypothetical protein